MKKNRFLNFAILILVAAGLFLISSSRAVEAQGENLLSNPSFEGAYSSYDPEPDIPDCPIGVCTTVQLPASWWPWWVSQQPGDPEWKNRNPEYKPAEAPFLNRVHGGARASQYFTFHSTHTAGLWQRAAVPANSQVRFSVWGHAWSSIESVPTSVYPTVVNLRVGIDPTGGTNPFSPAIVWSGYAQVYDNYALFQVEAQAQGEFVTVFTSSAPVEARKHNDVYWDDASLEVIGAGSATAPPPAGSGSGSGSSGNTAPPPAAPIPIGPTPTPNAEGIIYVEVQPGDSLWSVAARSGISLDEILALNELSRTDFVNAGDLLIIGYGDAAAPVPEASGGVEAESEEEAAVEETAADLPPATSTPMAEAAATTGDICIRAYDDGNENGVYDDGETIQSAVAFTISSADAVVSNYVTTGAETTPYCIEGLEPGTYNITRSVRADERATSPSNWAVTLTAGGTLAFDFGTVAQAPADAIADSTAGDGTESDAADAGDGALEEDGGSNILVYVIVAIAILLIAGIGFVVLSARRSAG